MTIRFAAARKSRRLPSCVVPSGPVTLDAANDNDREPFGDRAVQAALRHFARYGLAAGDQARAQAQAAGYAGDLDRATHWLKIYRCFDRRRADALETRLAQQAGGAPSRT